MRGSRGDVGDHVFGADLNSIFLRQEGEQLGPHVGNAGVRIAPEWEGAATSAVVVVKVRNESSDSQRGTGRRRRSRERRKKNLLLRAHSPQFGVWAIDHAIVRDDPLSVERAESVAHRRRARAVFISDWQRTRLETRERERNDAFCVSVAKPLLEQVRMKECLLFRRRRSDERLPPSLQRVRIRRDDPSAAWHHARAVVDEEIFQRGKRRPRARRSGQEGSAPVRWAINPGLAADGEFVEGRKLLGAMSGGK